MLYILAKSLTWLCGILKLLLTLVFSLSELGIQVKGYDDVIIFFVGVRERGSNHRLPFTFHYYPYVRFHTVDV